jgi:ATP-dependent Clp protease ATP-binding subunit ClpA
MTSNLRSLEQMREVFRPEFLNRIDEIVEFVADEGSARGDCRAAAGTSPPALAERIELELTDEAKHVWLKPVGIRPRGPAAQARSSG